MWRPAQASAPTLVAIAPAPPPAVPPSGKHDLSPNGEVALVVMAIVLAILFLALALGLPLAILRATAKDQRARREILQQGVPARARIVGIRHGSGVSHSSAERLELDLEVYPDQAPAFPSRCHLQVPKHALGSFRASAEIRVRYLAHDPGRLTVDLAAMGIG